MILSLIIAAIIGLYVLWVLDRKIKDVRNGKCCGGECAGCLKPCSVKKDEL